MLRLELHINLQRSRWSELLVERPQVQRKLLEGNTESYICQLFICLAAFCPCSKKEELCVSVTNLNVHISGQRQHYLQAVHREDHLLLWKAEFAS